MEILYIEDHLDKIKNIAQLVNSVFNDKITYSSLEEAIDFIEKHKGNIKLVLWNYRKSSLTLLKFILSLIPNVPLVIINDELKKDPASVQTFRNYRIEFISKSEVDQTLPIALKKIKTKLTLDSENDEQDPMNFIQMSIELFQTLKPLNTDIYFRLSENKFIKIYSKEDKVNETDLRKYIEKSKFSYFYIKAISVDHVILKEIKSMDDLLESKDSTPKQERTAIENHLELIHELTQKIGVTPQIQALTKKNTALTLKMLGQNPRISAIFKRMKQGDTYIPHHSVVLAEICCSISNKLGWNSETTYMKLTLASMLHDIALKSERLAKIQTLKELSMQTDLTITETNDYMSHPYHAANYAREFSEIPQDVDTILMEHHETPDGTGFPKQLVAARISPLGSIFIIAHDLLNYLMTPKKEKNLKDFISSRESVYNTGVFKEVLRVLQKEISQKTKRVA